MTAEVLIAAGCPHADTRRPARRRHSVGDAELRWRIESPSLTSTNGTRLTQSARVE